MTEWIITSSVLIVVVVVLRALFRRKIGRRLQYALWAIVLLRLLIPFTVLSSPLSIMNLARSVQSPGTAYINYESELSTNMSGHEADWTIYEKETAESATEIKSPFTASFLFTIIWIAGGIIVGLWFIGANLVFYRRLRKARIKYCHSDCRLPVYVSENIASPCLFGIPLPAIYLTPKAIENETGIRNVITHELCHYRHADHIWSVLRGICIAVWWWNPLVWTAAVMSRTDGELACDEAVIMKIGEEKRLEYGRTLVDMIAVRKSPVGLMHAATTMVSGKHSAKERLDMIIKKPKAIVPALIAVVLIIAVSAGCTFTGAKADESLLLDEKIEAGLLDPDPLVRRAWEMIRQDIQTNEETSGNIFGDEGTTFTDAEITKLEMTHSFDNIYEGAVIEVYELNYRMRPKDLSKVMLAGGMQIKDDWLLEKGSMGSPSLVVKNISGERTYIGTIYPAAQGVLDATYELLSKLNTDGKQNEEADYDYINTKYNFTFSAPSNWKDKYKVIDNGGYISFVYTDYKMEDGSYQEFFRIAVMAREDYEKVLDEKPMTGMLLAENDDRAYVLYTPLDMAIMDSQKADEYRQLYLSREQIKQRFRIIENGLESTGPKPLTGYIVIEDGLLYLDPVEIIMTEDKERIAELELRQTDMPNGYYIYNKDTEKQTYELTKETRYTFVDMELIFVKEDDGNRLYTTTDKDEFVLHLETSYTDSPPAQKVPFFIEIKDGKVISITEKFEYTI